MKIVDIARICHAANKEASELFGDFAQSDWDMTPERVKLSAVSAVRFRVEFPDASIAEAHRQWKDLLEYDGWVYGPERDEQLKTHPCMCAYEDLNPQQMAKKRLFKAIVLALKPYLDQNV